MITPPSARLGHVLVGSLTAALLFLDFLFLPWLLLRPDFFFVGIRLPPFCCQNQQEARHQFICFIIVQ